MGGGACMPSATAHSSAVPCAMRLRGYGVAQGSGALRFHFVLGPC